MSTITLLEEGACVRITAYDHVGLRVTNRAQSLAFYGALGFHLDEEHSTQTALEIVNEAGVRLNLILNGRPTPQRDNVLMDRPQKWPGYTYAAFIVDRLSGILEWAAKKNVSITEGPVDWGRRITCFVRDPDSNVLEFNELKAESRPDAATYTLVLGQKNYSSWSMRAWLLLKTLDVPFAEVTIPLHRPESRQSVRCWGGQTGLVPVLIDSGTPIWDTLAIFEHLYESHSAVWPAQRLDRARARSISGEIHSAFSALSSAMPVNTRARGRHPSWTAEVMTDIERVVQIWNACDGGSPWLFGSFSGADIMFAPVATRFQTYGVHLEGRAKSPWIGVMLVGYASARVFESPGNLRDRRLKQIGLAMLLAFIVLRAADVYGEPHHWHFYPEHAASTVMSFLATTKYPPSLLYLLATLGSAALICAYADRLSGGIKDVLVTFGRTPLAFYVAHLYLLHSLAILLGVAEGFSLSQFLTAYRFFPKGYGVGLGGVYLAWIAVVALLYPLCRRVMALKARRSDWWLSYV